MNRPSTIGRMSIRGKLALIALLPCLAALLVFGASWMAYEWHRVKQDMVEDVSSIGRLLADRSVAALLFDDSRLAGENLSALRTKPGIVFARILAADGSEFATYGQKAAGVRHCPPERVQDPSHRFQGRHLLLSEPIISEGRPIGTINICAGLHELTVRLHRSLLLAVGCLCGALLLALSLASGLLRYISEPIHRLTQAADRVAREKDYAVRAAKTSDDELGHLADTFNGMLETIERQRGELIETNRTLERRVAERTGDLETTNKELEAFSYSVSHDLRAPLRAIDGFSHILLEDCGDRLDAEGKETLNRIRTATQRMGQLIEDLLNLSRITRAEMRRVRVDLSAIAHDVAEELRQQQPDRSATFSIADGLAVFGDPSLLRVVLVNLLGNAWKFTGQRGQTAIEFGQSRQDGRTAYFVKDNGAGFDMAYAGKLFGAFQRLHAATEFPGTGIGLATVQRIVHRHGGRVWAAGEVGKGATFYFTLKENNGPDPRPAQP